MHYLALLFFLSATISWLLFWSLFYFFLNFSLILSYTCFWSPDERKTYCPHGLLSAILHNK